MFSLKFRRLLSFFLVLLLLPGWGEVFESVAHLLHDGHLPHSEEHMASAEAEHESVDEHGCTAISHVCPCHSTVPALVGDAPAPGSADVWAQSMAFIGADQRPLSRANAPPTRPPIV